MRANREYRDRPSTEVAVLDALVNRQEDGMTVLELRAAVDVSIDDLEAALAALKDDDLIRVDAAGSKTIIKPADAVVPDEAEPETSTFGDWLRERIPF